MAVWRCLIHTRKQTHTEEFSNFLEQKKELRTLKPESEHNSQLLVENMVGT